LLAARTVDSVATRLRDLGDVLDPAALRSAALRSAALRSAALRSAGRGDLAGGLFAVAMVRHGAAFGWAAEWRDLLRELRRHPQPEVRDEAYLVEMTG
jgi:uncharacterized protein YjeT (DUF2065 family)